MFRVYRITFFPSYQDKQVLEPYRKSVLEFSLLPFISELSSINFNGISQAFNNMSCEKPRKNNQ